MVEEYGEFEQQIMDNPAKVTYLTEKLGADLAALIGGAADTETVARWQSRVQEVSEEEAKRFDAAFKWVHFLDQNKVSEAEIQGLIMGENISTEEGLMSPARVFSQINKAKEPEKLLTEAMLVAKHHLA